MAYDAVNAANMFVQKNLASISLKKRDGVANGLQYELAVAYEAGMKYKEEEINSKEKEEFIFKNNHVYQFLVRDKADEICQTCGISFINFKEIDVPNKYYLDKMPIYEAANALIDRAVQDLKDFDTAKN